MPPEVITLDEALARRAALQPAPPDDAALIGEPPWPGLRQTRAPVRASIGRLGALAIGAITAGYWQYVVHTVLLLEIDGLVLTHPTVAQADDLPRSLVGLTGVVPGRADLRVDLEPVLRAALAGAPIEAIPLLDLLARHALGAEHVALATVEPHRPPAPAWPAEAALAPPCEVAIARTFRRDRTISGWIGGWREVTCAVRLRASADGWCFERVPVLLRGEEGIPMS